MTVYVVTAGTYSDYHICAVFSTEEKALEYAGLAGGEWNERGVEPYEVDAIGNAGLWAFDVDMDYLTGDNARARSEEEANEPDSELHVCAEYIGWETIDGPAKAQMLVLARDAQHAIKIVNEKRIQHRALGLPMPEPIRPPKY